MMTAFERFILALVSAVWGDTAREYLAMAALADLQHELASLPATVS